MTRDRPPTRLDTPDRKSANGDAAENISGDAARSGRSEVFPAPVDVQPVSVDGKLRERGGAVRSGEKIAEPTGRLRSAIADLLSPLKRGDGVRVGAVGPTGSGKSYALRAVVLQAVPLVDGVYVCADKPGEAKNWNGQERIDLADCRDRPLVRRADGGSRVIVLSGDPFARRFVDPDAVAADAWKRAAPPSRMKVAVVVDELRRAAKGQYWRTPDGDLPLIFTEGRSVGLSAFWGCQSPQDIPRDALGQSDLLLFRVEGREAEYLRKYRLISDDLAPRIATLPDHSFVIRRIGRPWDGQIYRF